MNIDNLSPTRLMYLKKRVDAAKNTIPDSLESMKAIYERGMMLVWSQEGDIGPREIFELLGTDGKLLFLNGFKLLQFILAEDPNWDYPKPTHEYIINEDGTVTIGDPIILID